MADRRTDESPLAPRRSLGAAGGTGPGPRKTTREQRDSDDQRRPAGERLAGAVASATQGVREATESRRTPDDRSSQAPDRRTRPSSAGSRGSGRPRSRRARLRLTHLDPWSVMKTSFLLSVAFGIVTVIAVAVVWSVLGAAGVWDSINRTVAEVIGGETGAGFDVENYVGTSRVMGFTMIVAVVDVILITAIATLGAFLYNLAAALLGGLEVTLTEDDH
jgi:hypothetical protein